MINPFLSPLRYPGGKRKLAAFMKLLLQQNDLVDGDYVEPYTGGASIALALLFEEHVQQVHINDLDRAVYAFWYSVLNETDALCRLVNDTRVSMAEWHRQKAIQGDTDVSLLELGFSTFFLNRTNRSGIIGGGVIGGKHQTGKWGLDARYNRPDLMARIQKIARYRRRIQLYNCDAACFISQVLPELPRRSLVYLDPPYYVKGQQLLYVNYYAPEDHAAIAQLTAQMQQKWAVSYDDVPQIRTLYGRQRSIDYNLHYSAQDRYRGNEVMFFCDDLQLPAADTLDRISAVRFSSMHQPQRRQ